MQTTFRLPESLPDDLARFEQEVAHFKEGSSSLAAFRAFRVPQGVYEQRENGTYMLRVRFPAGGVLPHQMRRLADVSRRYGNGVLHVTTRQDIQVHRVLLDDIHPALVELFQAGLSSKGGGGNTVRNITACSDAGVCPNEVFDVTPYALALTEFLLPDPANYQLPRKYKIAFSGCSNDCAAAMVNDLGLFPKQRGEQPGFAVYVGGGLGARSRVAQLLEDFRPAEEVHFVAEAVKRVFDKHGNRKNKHRARLRFLIEEVGLEQFREWYQEELASVSKEVPPRLELRQSPLRTVTSQIDEIEPGEGFGLWRKRNVVPQKQEDHYLVRIPLPLGDISADALEALADVVEQYGEGVARTTQAQNLILRWIPERDLASLHARLAELELAVPRPPILRDAVACAGASTCRLGICLSRGLEQAIDRELCSNGLDLESLGDLELHISGCPNSCGRHAIADIGFFGAARRVSGRLVPHYTLQLGGHVEEGNTQLARSSETLPARNIPAFVADFLREFEQSPHCPDYGAFLEHGGREIAEQIAATHREVPGFEEDKNYYFDWGAEQVFSLAGRGPGECSAGVFDLIEVDLSSAREALAIGDRRAATALAARALLVTQGQEAKDDVEACRLFERHFVQTGLVQESFRDLLHQVMRGAAAASLEDRTDEVTELVAEVQELYDTMDPSLRFRPVAATREEAPQPAEPKETPAQEATELPQPDREGDFRGVVCPLNYVKTKLVLSQMKAGQVLALLLDSDGAKNVPESAQKDGHEVLSVTQEDGSFRVLIRR